MHTYIHTVYMYMYCIYMHTTYTCIPPIYLHIICISWGVHMYICIWIYVYVCVCIRITICISTCIPTCDYMHPCMRACMHACMYNQYSNKCSHNSGKSIIPMIHWTCWTLFPLNSGCKPIWSFHSGLVGSPPITSSPNMVDNKNIKPQISYVATPWLCVWVYNHPLTHRYVIFTIKPKKGHLVPDIITVPSHYIPLHPSIVTVFITI